MKTADIYQVLRTKAIEQSHFFGRGLHVVSLQDFVAFEAHFRPSYNLLNQKENYRTCDSFRHIHAIKIGDVVEFHYDYSNPDRGILYVVMHSIFDVTPYFLYFLVTLRPPYARLRRFLESNQDTSDVPQ